VLGEGGCGGQRSEVRVGTRKQSKYFKQRERERFLTDVMCWLEQERDCVSVMSSEHGEVLGCVCVWW